MSTAVAPPTSRRNWAALAGRVALFLLLAVALFAAARWLPIPKLIQWVRDQGPWAPVLFILAYVIACVFLLPGSLLTLAAGVLFGPIWGTVWTSIGATLGATAAFLTGRFLARDWIQRRIQAHPRFAAIDAAIGTEGWKIVGLLRLSPVFPFSLLNYGLGLTKVRLRDYVFASWAGMLPATALYVYVGSVAGEAILQGKATQHTRTPMEWTLYGLGFVATLAVTILVTRIARTALNRRIA